jgi:hypothetical protein
MKEKIIDKLKKIQEYAERGDKHEAESAKKLLSKLLERHGLSLDDISDEQRKMYCIKTTSQLCPVLFMCFVSFLNEERRDRIFAYRGKRFVFYVELSAIEYVDLMQLYEFHTRQFKKELKKELSAFEAAYQYKHNLYSHDESPSGESEYELEDISRIINIINNLENIHFRKQLKT